MRIKAEIDEIPPTVNHYWGKKGKVWYVSKKAKNFKEKIAWIILAKKETRETALKMRENCENVKISIRVFLKDNRKRDIDNMLKGILDALKGVVYEDDSIVSLINIEKIKSKKIQTEIIVECANNS